MAVLFITEAEIKSNTAIQNNVDVSLITPYIETAQLLHIQPILCEDLYNDLVTNISAGTISSDYQTLLDEYIQPALSNWVFYEALPFLYVRITNKGLLLKSSDNSESVDVQTYNMLRENVKDIAQYQTKRLQKFLIDNRSLYPLYICDDCDGPNDPYNFNQIVFY